MIQNNQKNNKKRRKKVDEKNKKNIYKRFVAIAVSFMLLVLIYITGNILVSLIKKESVSFFGFSVNKVLSDSMKESGFVSGDIVVTQKINSDSKVGDFVTFLVMPGNKPYKSGDNLADTTVWFHQIVSTEKLDGITYYQTKGTSNSVPDPFKITNEAIVGKYYSAPAAVTSVLGFLAGNTTAIVFIVLIAMLLLTMQIINLISFLRHRKIANQIINRQTSFFCYENLTYKLYKNFSKNQKDIVYRRFNKKYQPLISYLLYGKPRGEFESINKYNKNDLMPSDMLLLTQLLSLDKTSEVDDYMQSLAKRGSKAYYYTEIADVKDFLISSVLFTGLFFLFAALTLTFSPLLLLLLLLPTSLVLLIIRLKSKYKKAIDNLVDLPKKYRYILSPANFSSEFNKIYTKVLDCESMESPSKILDSSAQLINLSVKEMDALAALIHLQVKELEHNTKSAQSTIELSPKAASEGEKKE